MPDMVPLIPYIFFYIFSILVFPFCKFGPSEIILGQIRLLFDFGWLVSWGPWELVPPQKKKNMRPPLFPQRQLRLQFVLAMDTTTSAPFISQNEPRKRRQIIYLITSSTVLVSCHGLLTSILRFLEELAWNGASATYFREGNYRAPSWA